jgi:subtilisin-like proprotein convertase family protein
MKKNHSKHDDSFVWDEDDNSWTMSGRVHENLYSSSSALSSFDTVSGQDMPTDSMLPSQWHLGSGTWSVNIGNIWNDYTGDGVVVGLLDDGFDYTHPDLAPNYRHDLDYDFADNDGDSRDSLTQNKHGTAVMGLIGADDNGSGTVGVAFDADLVGYRIEYGTVAITHIAEALEGAVGNVDVLNNSWGFTRPFSLNFSRPGFERFENALMDLAKDGRDGLGTVTLFAGGNDREDGESGNYHNLQNSPYTISVGATDQDGTYSYFSSPGASLLVSAPGTGLLTTDKTGVAGYDSGDYAYFSGTSASTPVVSGIVALMLEANPDLGYRDVQEILAYSARHNDPSSTGWAYNGAGNWNGGGLHFSHDYGFGLVDAHAAVRLAESWGKNQTYSNMQSVGDSAELYTNIPDEGTIVTDFTIAEDIEVEHVLVYLDIWHSWSGDLTVTLTSPSGTESVLVDRIGNGSHLGNIDFEFSSTAHWGESSAGTWTLTIEDMAPGNSGKLNEWSLEILGNDHAPSESYIFTDDYGNFTGAELAARSTIDNAGLLNFAALSSAVNLDLGAGSAMVAGNPLTIDSPDSVQKVIGSDGDDLLEGGSGDDLFYGERGSDVIKGANGNDELYGGLGDDELLYGGDGDDKLYGEEGNDELRGGDGNDILFGGNGDDELKGQDGDDILVGGAGMDNLNGNEGLDTVDYSANTQRVYINLGRDEADENSDGLIDDKLPNIENAIGTDYNDTIIGGGDDNVLYGGDRRDRIKGSKGDDEIHGEDGDDILLYGGVGNDMIYGGEGIDELRGGDDDDMLDGGEGDDVLKGQDGNDILIGGRGSDDLTGGHGSDTYKWLSGDVDGSVDTISGFSTGRGDMLDISDILSGYDPLADLITDFVRITDDGTSSTLSVDADGGADNFVALAMLVNKLYMTDEAGLETDGTLITV